MTNEMLRIILRLALTNLLALPSATLHALLPWVRREHIRFCLDHAEELRLEDAEDVEVRQWLQEAAQLLKQERAVPQKALQGGCRLQATGELEVALKGQEPFSL